jgi:formate hydrogenlyase subunit 6/NADH:ubiquinone oxidoreductase subunit I
MKRLPTIDEKKCSGCGHCVDICPQQALVLTVQPTTPLFRKLLGLPFQHKAQLQYPQACIGCGHCASVCRHRAISIEKTGIESAVKE